MSIIRASLRRQSATAAAVALASVAAACSDTTGPSSPVRSAPPPSARPALAIGGNTIVFQRDSAGLSGIYTMNDDGTNLTRLIAGERPAWSPDHSKIVFEANHTVFIMNADGSGAKPVTGITGDRQPSFNGDGTKVVLVHDKAKTESSEIFIVNVDGTNRQLLAKVVKTSLGAPRISPDGTKLAVQALRRLGSAIVVIDLATGRRTVVADSPNNEQLPAWSPDSKRLAFMTGVLDKGQCIGIVNADGTGFRTFANDVAFCSTVSWSPDGNELAFTSITAGTAGIYRAPVDEAGAPTRLTTPAATALDVKLSWTR
jgi:Tol biopolymer transport system component